MPKYDFKCARCERTEEITVSNWKDATTDYWCEFCGGKLTKLPSAPNFTVSGYNASNGYSK